jgi:hypothetical protein
VVYLGSMMVLTTSTGITFHTSPPNSRCPALTRGRTLIPEDLTEAIEINPRILPCHRCFPDFPTAKILHRYCPKCNKSRVYPCPHNGGVPVDRTIVSRGYVFTRRYWIWAENEIRYEQPLAGSLSHM